MKKNDFKIFLEFIMSDVLSWDLKKISHRVQETSLVVEVIWEIINGRCFINELLLRDPKHFIIRDNQIQGFSGEFHLAEMPDYKFFYMPKDSTVESIIEKYLEPWLKHFNGVCYEK